jgi:hypothetical protein
MLKRDNLRISPDMLNINPGPVYSHTKIVTLRRLTVIVVATFSLVAGSEENTTSIFRLKYNLPVFSRLFIIALSVLGGV